MTGPVSSTDSVKEALAPLIRTLHETHKRIEELTNGSVDAVLEPLSGLVYLLPGSQEHLRLSEHEQRRFAAERDSILDALPAHIVLLDRNGGIVTANRAWRRFAVDNHLLTKDFAVGQNYIAVCDRAYGTFADEARAVADGIRSVLGGDAAHFTIDYPCHSLREKRWFRLAVTPLQPGAAGGAVAMHIDITEQQLAADALRASEERFRGSFRDAITGMAITDLQGRFLKANASYCRMLGYSESELKATNFLHVTHPDDRSMSIAVQEELVAGTRNGLNFEKRYRSKSGETVWCRLSKSVLRDSTGQSIEHIVIAEDISERKEAERNRDETEKRFRQLAETIEDAFWLEELDGTPLYLSPAFERIWGVPIDDLYGSPRRWLSAVHQDDRRRVEVAFDSMTAGTYDVEYRIVRPDGSLRWIADRGFPVRDSSNKITRVAGTARDITERKLAQEQLVLSEVRFQLLAKATNDAIWDWDLVSGVVWRNQGFETLFGIRVDEIQPNTESWQSRIHADDFDRVITGIYATIDGGTANWSAEYRFRREDGRYAYVMDRGRVIRDVAGKPLRMIGGMIDLTQRKMIEERLAEQAALLDVAQDAIVVRGVDHRVLFWNRSAERMYGWASAEAVGRSIEDLVYGDPAEFRRATVEAIDRGHWTGRINQHRKDGSMLTVQGNWTLMRNPDGTPRSILAVNTDITDRIELEDQLRQSQRLEAVGQLTGGIAHDFNNLLTVILGNAELLAESLIKDKKLWHFASMTMAAAMRAAELTQRLLAFSRRQALDPVVLDVNQVLAGMEGLLRRTLTESLSIELVQAEDLWHALVDPAQLESAVLNLCINARDAMTDQGKITIETRNARLDRAYAERNAEVVPGDYAMIAVSDTGCGIPSEIVGRVFDPFFTTKGLGKGTGLGLSMVYGFIKQSGGHVKIYSEAGHGTTVKLYLPRSVDEIAAPESPTEVLAATGGSETILMVEDDELVRLHVERELKGLGYRVLSARNGPAALEIVRAEPNIDLLFTDVIMPGGMNGKQLADAVRGIRRGIAVLFTSGYTEEAIVHQGRFDMGAPLLSKPYLHVELARMIRVALARKAGTEAGAGAEAGTT